MSLHPEVEKEIEAGPTAEEWEHWGEHGNFVPFARRIAALQQEKEREACAKIAENAQTRCTDYCTNVAAAIRRRGKP